MGRSTCILGAIVLLVIPDLEAATHADSILAFTGASRAKFVWLQNKWCSDDYQPISSSAWRSDKFALVGYDTKDNKVRVLNSAVAAGNYGWVSGRTDRSGKWVVWNDVPNKRCMIRDFDVTSSARVLIPAGNTMWYAVAFGYEKATNTQYLYVADSYDAQCYCAKTSMAYKIPFSSRDGTVDLGSKVDLGFRPSGGYQNLGISSVSADGRYIACSWPWPTDYIFDVQTKKIIDRKGVGSQFGCQPNIAPDNSYRFFHCMDDHEGIHMFSTNLTIKETWTIVFHRNNNLCGRAADDISYTDFEAPAWSNNPRYLSNTYPMAEGSYMEDGVPEPIPGNVDATWVKTKMRMKYKPSVFLQKFAPDFKSISASMYIVPDLRSTDKELNSWLSNGEVTPDADAGTAVSGASSRRGRTGGITLTRAESHLTARDPAVSTDMVLRIHDVCGRVVRFAAGANAVSVSTNGLRAGVYTISVVSSTGTFTESLSVTR